MAELESGLLRVNDNIYALARVDELSDAEKYGRFGQLPANIYDKLTADAKATLARLGPYIFNDATREDSLTQNWCAFKDRYGTYTGECKLDTTNVSEGRGVYYNGGDLHEGYFKNNNYDGPMRKIRPDGSYLVG